MEIQNYPISSGEWLRHDPTLTVYYDEYEVKKETGGKKPFIPGYNYSMFITTIGTMTLIIMLEKRRKKSI